MARSMQFSERTAGEHVVDSLACQQRIAGLTGSAR
jgi:hypothetical protein